MLDSLTHSEWRRFGGVGGTAKLGFKQVKDYNQKLKGKSKFDTKLEGGGGAIKETCTQKQSADI